MVAPLFFLSINNKLFLISENKENVEQYIIALHLIVMLKISIF